MRLESLYFFSATGEISRHSHNSYMPNIQIQNLTKSFDKIKAVNNVTLDIPQGQLFFLLGPSGCGKTTLLRAIAGFVTPDQGSIKFGEQEVINLEPHKRHCSMVFQGYALWPHMTIAQNLAFGLEIKKVKSAQRKILVQEALQAVQLQDHAHKKPNALSGGQQQRVALARALVVKPKILLLDEPLSNLDALLRLEMRSQIRQVCKDANITAVYVTHDQQEALSMADQIALMHQGKVIQVGTPRQLYETPANKFAADFLGQSNFIPATILAQEDNRLILNTPLGILKSAVFTDKLKNKTAINQEVICSIRYEAISLATNNTSNQENTFTAIVKAKTYLGDTMQYQLRTQNGGIAIHALTIANPLHDRFEKGQPLYVHISPEQVVVLTD